MTANRLLPVTAALLAAALLALPTSPAQALGEGWMEAYEWREDWPLRSLEGWTYVVAGRKVHGKNTGIVVRAAECEKTRCVIPKPADAVEPIYRLGWNSKIPMIPDAPPQLWARLELARPGSEGVSPLLGGEKTLWAAVETGFKPAGDGYSAEDEAFVLGYFKRMLNDGGHFFIRGEENFDGKRWKVPVQVLEFLVPTERFEESGGLKALQGDALAPAFDSHKQRDAE